MVKLKNDKVYIGTIKSETDDEFELNTANDGVVKIKKDDIVNRKTGLSAMPEDVSETETEWELLEHGTYGFWDGLAESRDVVRAAFSRP